MNLSNPLVLKHLQHVQKTHGFNVDMSMMWLDFLKIKGSFTSSKSLSKTMKAQNLTLEQAYVFEFLSALDLEGLHPVARKKINDLITRSIKQLSIEDYHKNPYYQTVKPTPVELKDWSLTYDTLQPFQGCVYNDVIIDPLTYEETTPIGFIDQPFRYLAIHQKDTTWMSVTPFEIHTMEPILKTLKGRVVALGLGLGYFAFMAALNPNVTHVTIIEKDKTAIDLFLNHIFPFFPYPKKITIVHQDALIYLATPNPLVDHLFVDIYHTAEDGLPFYLSIKKIEPLWKKTVFTYWLEQSILGLLRRYMCIYLSLTAKTSLKAYPPFAITLLKNIDHVHQHTVINTVNDLNQWLSNASMLAMIQQFP